jgi:hypothetical protein
VGPFKIVANEVAIGLTMPATAIEVCKQRLAPAHFVRAVMQSEEYNPASAVEAGFLDRVVPPSDLQHEALEVANRLAKLDLKAHYKTKLRARYHLICALKKANRWRLPSGISAAEEAQAQLGEDVRVVAAFQNIGTHHLLDLDVELDCDVLVCGDRAVDKEVVLQLCKDARLRGVNAGALQNSRAVEELTAVLIAINVIHKVKSAGIRITGLPDA